jgi:uncharacterized tellurite resistance protein B-like protein
MPVAYCSGREPCDRLISISAVPGGNPAALAEPETYACEWALCSCNAYTCDRCLWRQQGRCRCGSPTRLLSEPERIQIAQGVPRQGGAHPHASPHAPVAPRVMAPPANGAEAPVGPVLEGVAAQIDAEFAYNRHERAHAMCRLAVSIMCTQGQHAPAHEVPWLLRFGENFYRWRRFDEGQQYWAGLYELVKQRRLETSHEGALTLATALAFRALAGSITASSPDAGVVLDRVVATLGPDHVLAREVQTRLASPPSPRSHHGPAVAPPPLRNGLAPAPANGQAPAARGGRMPRAKTIVLENLTVLPPPVAASVAHYDEPTRLALWVTLAFLDVAFADGHVVEQEYHSWVNTMRGMGLPDVWTRFGQQALGDMMSRGVLYDLSSEFAWLPVDRRNGLATMLVEFMVADGRAEPNELEAVKRIGGWIEVKISFR